jgi:RimJ/RimL family protein N-acetyltransferase
MYDRNLRIETVRLVLRQPRLEELDDWASFMRDAENMRFIGGVQPRMSVWRYLMVAVGSWSAMGFGMFSVLDRRSGEWLGRVGPTMPEGWPGTEVGWSIRREYWHQGYATEASRAAMDWVFEQLGWSEVIHCIAPDNLASQALARRLGSDNRGPGKLPAPLDDTAVELWGQTRAQWHVNRNALLPARAGAQP